MLRAAGEPTPPTGKVKVAAAPRPAPAPSAADRVSLGSTPVDAGLMPRPAQAPTPLDNLVARIIPRGDGQPGTLELRPFEKRSDPIMQPRAQGFDSRNIYNMATIRENGTTYMLYRGEDKGEPAGQCTGRIGLATSQDDVHFTREDKPVLVPEHDYEKRGIEDPRLVKVDGTYYLTYTGYDGDKAKLCLATSKDLKHWDKHGPIFPHFPATGDWTKSGAILPEKVKSGLFKDRYVMYFGDSNIWMAFSDDLVHWTPLMNPVIQPRGDRFDSSLVESGPPPFYTKDGILMIYNSAGPGGYHVGAVLLDQDDPTRIIARTDQPVLSPTQPWERNGYINNVVFAEGMAVRGQDVDLFYGGADHDIGLAVSPGVSPPVASALVNAAR